MQSTLSIKGNSNKYLFPTLGIQLSSHLNKLRFQALDNLPWPWKQVQLLGINFVPDHHVQRRLYLPTESGLKRALVTTP